MTRALVLLVVMIAAAGCEREKRDFTLPNGDQVLASTRLTELQPGAASPPAMIESPLQNNAYALSEGKRLYGAYNCSGCHAQGGGSIGPALMDHRWIYGNRPDQIYSTIVQGRPNGMPTFGSRIPEQQVWQLVAYVQSMSGEVRKDAAPARNDDMQTGKSEMRRAPQLPIQTGHR
ncbi:MAG TPA: c-type cytochrome [Vicinamibacterales bacterium]|nr:c-type cytochrome [Vicinamibacterales bacterium]